MLVMTLLRTIEVKNVNLALLYCNVHLHTFKQVPCLCVYFSYTHCLQLSHKQFVKANQTVGLPLLLLEDALVDLS